MIRDWLVPNVFFMCVHQFDQRAIILSLLAHIFALCHGPKRMITLVLNSQILKRIYKMLYTILNKKLLLSSVNPEEASFQTTRF